MKKFKALLLGALSVLTLGLFVVTGAKVNAETASFSYEAYGDVLNTASGGNTAISNVSNGEVTGWYNPTAVLGTSIPAKFYSSFSSTSSGKINKIGNNNSALVSGIPAKYKENITITSTYTRGFVLSMDPIAIDSLTIYAKNDKTNAGETFVLLTNDGENYYQYGNTIDSSTTKANPIDLTFSLSAFNTALSTASSTDCSSNTLMGYAVIMSSSGNVSVVSNGWKTTYSKNVEVTSTFYDVNFYDEDGNKLNDLYQSIEEDGVVDEDLAVAPGVWGKTFSYWATRSGSAGNYTYTKYNFDTTVSSNLDLYAVYTDWSADVISDENVLDYSLMQKGLDAFGANATSTSDRALTGTIYTLAKGGTQFRTANGKINAISTTDAYSAAINTGGNVNNSQNALKFTVENAGSITVYAKNGGGDGNKLGIYDSSCDELTTEDLGSNIIAYTFDVDAGTYFIGGASGSAWIYYASFEEETTPEVTVTAYQQEAVDGAYTYVRFIFVVSNDTTLATADFANKLTLILDDGLESQQTVTRSPKAYNKITLGGSTYTNGDYEFDNSVNTNDIYVVYVVKFTTETYVGHNIKASLNVNSTDYKTSGYDFE